MDETLDLGTQVTAEAVELESDGSGMKVENESCEMVEFGTEMVKMEMKSDPNLRAEIDTSAPFESVKEAVCRFGGIGYWRPAAYKLSDVEYEKDEGEEISIAKLEEQVTQLENDLILKQRETLGILQELEATRAFVEELKVKLQKEVFDFRRVGRGTNPEAEVDDDDEEEKEEEDKENKGYYLKSQGHNFMEGLMHAQQNLTKTTNGIAEIRASIEIFNRKMEKDRLSLEKTRVRLTENSLKMFSIEEQLNQTKQKLQAAKDGDNEYGSEILKELQILNSEAEKFKQMGEAAKSEIMKKISKIQRKKAKIRTAEIRLVAVAKMKEAARVAEALALADIKVLSSQEFKSMQQQQQVDKPEALKMEILMKQVKEATKEIRSTKFAMEEALNSIEAANKEKVAVEEAIEKWRSEQDKDMPLISCPISVSEPKLVSPILKPTLSIGQILSRKLFLQEELMSAEKSFMKRKVSLAQMLGKQNHDRMNYCRKSEKESQEKQSSRKRKKSGFARLSVFLAKQTNQKRKKPTPNLK